MRNTIIDLVGFLRNPRDELSPDQSPQFKIKRFLLILVIDVLVMIPLICLLSVFEQLGWLDSQDSKLINLFISGTFWLVFIGIVFIAPFFEEIIFRLFLRYKRNYLLRLIGSIFPKQKTILFDWWTKKYRYVFYLAAIVFGLLHITNYEIEAIVIYIIPILVLPQVVMGILIGYLRVKFDFILGFLLHASHNAIVFGITLLALSQSNNHKLNIDNDRYSLKIEDVSILDYTGNSKVNNSMEDSISFKEVDLKSMLFYLTNVDLDLIETNKTELVRNKLIVNFKNKTSKKINRDSIILKHLGDLYLFKLEKKQRKQKVQVLYTTDNLKLLKYTTKNKGIFDVEETVTKRVLKYKNTSLPEIIKSLSSNYKIHFKSEIILSQKFDLTVPNGDLDKLKKTLKSDYGIDTREEKDVQVDYLFVNFKDDK